MRRQMVTTLYNNYDNSLSRTESLGVYNKRILNKTIIPPGDTRRTSCEPLLAPNLRLGVTNVSFHIFQSDMVDRGEKYRLTPRHYSSPESLFLPLAGARKRDPANEAETAIQYFLVWQMREANWTL